MKKTIWGLGSLSIIALSPISIVSCSEVSMNTKVQKELGYLDSNGKPNLEIKLNLEGKNVFEVIGFKPMKDAVKNDIIESFVTKNLKITEKFNTISEYFTVAKFEPASAEEKIVKPDGIELKNGKVIVEFRQPDPSEKDDAKRKVLTYGKKQLNLKDCTIGAASIQSEIFSKIKASDIEITSINKTKANFEAKINEKTDFGKLLVKFEELTTAKFTIEFVSATDANGNVKADSDTLVKTDKVKVKVAIKDFTNAKEVIIDNVEIDPSK